MTNDTQLCRVEFPTFVQMPTRWMDNDAYGHMNNIVHYALIDTAVTDWQRDHGFFNKEHAGFEFMVVESGCRYFSEAAYPDKISVGLKINKIGKVTTTEPAIKYCLGVSAPTFKNCIALDNVNELGLSKNISENKNSFQAIINTYNATDAIAGKLKGKMILTIIPNQFCPSIIPASSSSFGILLKYPWSI